MLGSGPILSDHLNPTTTIKSIWTLSHKECGW